jgi:hypothetical protein
MALLLEVLQVVPVVRAEVEAVDLHLIQAPHQAPRGHLILAVEAAVLLKLVFLVPVVLES